MAFVISIENFYLVEKQVQKKIVDSGIVKTCDELDLFFDCLATILVKSSRGWCKAKSFGVGLEISSGKLSCDDISFSMTMPKFDRHIDLTEIGRVTTNSSPLIEFTTCFHESSKYKSTNFFTNVFQLKKKTNF